MELSKKVVEECVNFIESDESIGGIIIPERSIGKSFWVKVRDFERSFFTSGLKWSLRGFFRKEV